MRSVVWVFVLTRLLWLLCGVWSRWPRAETGIPVKKLLRKSRERWGVWTREEVITSGQVLNLFWI